MTRAAWQALVSDGSARPAAFELSETPPDVGFIGGDLFVLSGEAKGKRIALVALNGGVASLGVVDLATIAKKSDGLGKKPNPASSPQPPSPGATGDP